MACSNIELNIQRGDKEADGEDNGSAPKIWYYKALEVIPEKRGHLHELLQKQPAAVGCVQMMSGLLSFGIGIIFAATQKLERSLGTLFRVSYLNGLISIFAGVLSVLLSKYPQLLQVSMTVNCSSVIVGAIALCLMSVDVADPTPPDFFPLEVLELCLLGFMIFLSGGLCLCFFREKHRKSP